MKFRLSFLLILFSIIFAFRYATGVVEDVGSTIDEVKQYTLNQVLNDQSFLPLFSKQIQASCKKLPPGVREVTVMNLGKIIREYVESAEFKNEYEKKLKEKFITTPYDPTSGDWEIARKKKEEEIISMMELMGDENLKTYAITLNYSIMANQALLNAMQQDTSVKSEYTKEELSAMIREDISLSNYAETNKPLFKKTYPEIMSRREMNTKMKKAKAKYEKSLKDVESRIDYKNRIKQKLELFLIASSDIDFDAKLKDGPKGVKQFEKLNLEQQSADRKLYFRCGKEAVNGARKFAKKWLKDLK